MNDHETRAALFLAIERGDREAVARLLAEQPTLASAHNGDGVSATLYQRIAAECPCLEARG